VYNSNVTANKIVLKRKKNRPRGEKYSIKIHGINAKKEKKKKRFIER